MFQGCHYRPVQVSLLVSISFCVQPIKDYQMWLHSDSSILKCEKREHEVFQIYYNLLTCFKLGKRLTVSSETKFEYYDMHISSKWEPV